MSNFWWLVIAVLTVVPFWILMPKFRLPQPLALVALIPYVGVMALLYVMAFRDQLKLPGIDK